MAVGEGFAWASRRVHNIGWGLVMLLFVTDQLLLACKIFFGWVGYDR